MTLTSLPPGKVGVGGVTHLTGTFLESLEQFLFSVAFHHVPLGLTE